VRGVVVDCVSERVTDCGLPENETTIRGFSDVTLMLIDEASRVPDEIYRAMRLTLVSTMGTCG
jgi:hypothetical protein